MVDGGAHICWRISGDGVSTSTEYNRSEAQEQHLRVLFSIVASIFSLAYVPPWNSSDWFHSLSCLHVLFTPSIIQKQVTTRSQSLCVISVQWQICKMMPLSDCQDCLTLSRSLCFSFTDGLFLGGSLAAKDKLQMKRLGITHILNLVGYGLYEVIYCFRPTNLHILHINLTVGLRGTYCIYRNTATSFMQTHYSVFMQLQWMGGRENSYFPDEFKYLIIQTADNDQQDLISLFQQTSAFIDESVRQEITRFP